MRATIVIKEGDITFFVSDFTKQSIKDFNTSTNIFDGGHKQDSFFYFPKDIFVKIYPSIKDILCWDSNKEREMFNFDNIIKK